MRSIKALFENDQSFEVPNKYKKRASKKCDHFKGFEETLPELKYPLENSNSFEEDLDEVRRCVKNPSLSKKFLDKSHFKSEDLFKKLLKDEDIDWKKLDKILEEFDGVIVRLKFKYNRPRPYIFFKERKEDIETKESGSPSFPSGHAAFSYFVSDYLSEILPNKRRELEKLASLICQSRIDNGVHFPSDISAGRFVGEQAAKFLLNDKKVHKFKLDKDTQKSFVRFLRERSESLRPNFSKEESLRYYSDDMAIFISETIGIDFDSAYDASKNLLEGYKISNCTENKEIQRLFEAMCQIFLNSSSDIRNIISLNKTLEKKSKLRNKELISESGVRFADSKKIEEMTSKIEKFNNSPFLKIAALNWIAPFEQGNSKIINLIFLNEVGFNFDITNQVLGEDLPFLLEKFYLENDMEKLIS